MTDRKTLKIDPDVWEDHNETRKEKGYTWSEYLKRCEFEGRDVDIEEELDKLKELVESVPTETAEQLERYR